MQNDSIIGKKDDMGKTQWSLIPWKEMEEVARVMEFGTNKYGRDNWRYVENGTDRYWNAAMRHLIEASEYKGALDKETKYRHLAHAVCCLLMCMYHADVDERKEEI